LAILPEIARVTEARVEMGLEDRRTRFFTLWTFATFNYVYADVVTLFDKSVTTTLSQTALLGAAILVETAIAMVLLSRVLKPRANR
jgi:predicted anti-sigma-YlaC factor YlaD